MKNGQESVVEHISQSAISCYKICDHSKLKI